MDLQNELVSLDEAKRQIPGYVDYGVDDELLTLYINSAQEELENRLQRKLTECCPGYPDCLRSDGSLAAPLRHAILIKVATSYDQRAAISFAKPYNTFMIENLITPYIKFKGAYA